MKEVSINRLHELFLLGEDGRLLRLVSRGNQRAGAFAGTQLASGYWTVMVDWVRMPTHRVVFAMANGRWPDADTDHADCDPGNNSPSNLRPATRSQNACNAGMKPNNKSGCKGVSWDKQSGKWRAQIMANGRKKNLGRFASKDSAAEAYADAAIQYHGQFARLS